MAHRQRTLTSLVVVVAMAFNQGCHAPGRARAGSIVPEARVFLTRASLFTLHHRGDDGAALQCTARQAEGTVLRTTTDSIFLRSVKLSSGPAVGACRIVGDAFVVMADVPGLAIQPRRFSVLRTTSLTVVTVSVFLTFLLLYALSHTTGGDSGIPN